ncbi:hypothetical protein LUZ60_013628 [Juncus effusus]|nr:hypothetical protein LUZ60_013628 [Juncus effusus]
MRFSRLFHSHPKSFSNSNSITKTNFPTNQHNKIKTKENKPTVKWDAEVIEQNKAIAKHMRDGHVSDAQQLFDQMPKRTISSYNTMLSGYVANSHFSRAASLFSSMTSRDVISYNTMLHCHVSNGDLNSAHKLFEEMPMKDNVSYNTLISAYARLGLVDRVKELFDRAPVRNNISFNGLLAAYLQNGRFKLALELFYSKQNWDIVSWNAMISAFAQRGEMSDAQKLFDQMPQRDNITYNTMISGYAQNGDMFKARKLFDEMPVKKDVFTWTAVVSGYAKNGNLEEARGVFAKMPERNIVSWNSIFSAYVQSRRLEEAKALFDQMPCRDTVSWNLMLTAYANEGMIEEAHKVFDEMPQRDTVSWSAMLSAYSQAGMSESALNLFIQMSRTGQKPNRSAFASLLTACADVASLQCGAHLHAVLLKAGYSAGLFAGNALIALYFKCGDVECASKVFDEMEERDTASWNTVVCGFGKHGFGREALEVFERMGRENVRPDDITLVGVLSACSHGGLVEKGISLFYSMDRVYGITPKPSHYTCMVDLLGRAGRLREALNLLEDLPFEPDASMWGALLAASRVHREPDVGKLAAVRILELEPDNAGMYVLLSNIYANYSKWSEVQETRVLMRERGVRKVPGFSWIEVGNQVHLFSVGDLVHPEKERIYAFLDNLGVRMKKTGFVSDLGNVLHDVEEEEKVEMLKYHSEKLAVAFGILNVPFGRPIRVMKNLRVCEDCHNAIKFISKIENRLIVLRDSNRFHHFSGGSCSCGDYW